MFLLSELERGHVDKHRALADILIYFSMDVGIEQTKEHIVHLASSNMYWQGMKEAVERYNTGKVNENEIKKPVNSSGSTGQVVSLCSGTLQGEDRRKAKRAGS